MKLSGFSFASVFVCEESTEADKITEAKGASNERSHWRKMGIRCFPLPIGCFQKLGYPKMDGL